jgi:type 1 glutamine amidotransferase
MCILARQSALLLLRIFIVFFGATGGLCTHASEASSARKILFIVGPSGHPPGTHEVAASARLLKYCVEQAGEGAAFQTELYEGWPTDPATLAQARVVVFSGDQFPPKRFGKSTEIFAQLSRMIEQGCSIVCVHYATSVNAREVSSAMQSSLYRWLGGFGHFLPGNVKPGTQARIMEATVTPTKTGHPVTRGVAPFSLRDEPYYPIMFDPTKSGAPVTPLATAMLPPEAPKEEIVAWSIDRGQGSRGVAVVMPHFFINWENDNLRKLVLNGIFWAAGVEVPPKGIESTLPSLELFKPKAIRQSLPEAKK